MDKTISHSTEASTTESFHEGYAEKPGGEDGKL